jgi:hypothetical protein
MASLVSWNKKTSKEETDLGVDDVRFVDSMETPQFIMKDEVNAKAMKAMKFKW